MENRYKSMRPYIPQTGELSQIERDLRFHPSPVTGSRTLTPEQVAAFNRDGYLKPLRVFDAEEIAVIREYFDNLLAQTLAAGGNSYSISTAHLSHGRVFDLLTHPRIVAHIKDLLGEDVIGWGSHFFCKMPGDGKRVSWHQDASYWPLTPSKAVTAWLAIDDASVENACMRYIPGTHLHGHLTYTLSEEDDANVLNQTVVGADQFGEPVDVELQSRRDVPAQRPSASRLRGESIGSAALRADASLLPCRCSSRVRLEQQRGDRLGPRS